MTQADAKTIDAGHAALCRARFMPYVRETLPWFQTEEVHYVMARYIERVAEGKIDRLMFSMAPRGSKSTLSSIALPSWWMGKFPSDKIMSVGYKTDLSRRFSRQTMGIMRTRQYGAVFPGVRLAKDAHAVGYWNVEDINEVYKMMRRGEYQAAGVTSGIAGSGYNLGIVDDPLSEQDKDSKLAKDRVWEWWGPGFYTRRQPERNAIIVIMTRWAVDDLCGRLLDLSRSGGDKWTVVNVPALVNGDLAKKIYVMASRYPMAKAKMPELVAVPNVEEMVASFCPRRVTLKELLRSRANMTMRDWNALYMGNPSEDEGHILKSRYWRLWDKKDLPECVLIFQTYDTAFEAHSKADFSACTTWGVFLWKDRDGRPTYNVILLGRWKRRIDAPDLAKVVEVLAHGSKIAAERRDVEGKKLRETDLVKLVLGEASHETRIAGHRPDEVLIENKVSGIQLVKELRKRRNPSTPVKPWTPPRGLRVTGSQASASGKEPGKYARAQLATLVLEQGCVWYPDKPWAVEVIDECAKCHFDGSDDSDDLPDTVVMAMLHVRQRFMVEVEAEVDEEDEAKKELAKRQRGQVRGYGAR